MLMMRDYEEDLHDLLTESKERLAESLVGAHRAESTDQFSAGCGITTKIPPLFDGSPSWFKYEELIDDWLDLTVLESRKTRTSTEEQTCRRCRNIQGTSCPRTSERCRWSQIFQERVETSLHERISECVPLEILSVHPTKKSKHRDGEVDRHVFIAGEEKKVSCRRGSGRMLKDEEEVRKFLGPNVQATRDRWCSTQVSNHEKIFPFSDSLTTFMFAVVCDLSEAQRERLTSFSSLQGINVTAHTFEAVRTVFVELLCTPKSSIENPSLRLSGHVSSTNRTFIVGDYAEDEFGQWAKDEVTGE